MLVTFKSGEKTMNLETSENKPVTEVAKKPRKKRAPKQSGQSAVSPSVQNQLSETGRVLVKIAAATKTIQKLTKKEHSANNDYTFVSIDDYYEQVALRVATEFGLNWGLGELPHMEQVFEDVYQDKHIRKVYQVTAFLDDGSQANLGAISVTMPYEGATTAGKMLSYADKAFMRQLFKIPTGEKEAEKSAPVKASERPAQRNAETKETFFKEGKKED